MPLSLFLTAAIYNEQVLNVFILILMQPCQQPERITGGAYDYRSDIWSLGLVLLECATGKFPYMPPEDNEGWVNFFELMAAIVDEPPPCAASDQFSSEFCSFISAW